MPQIKTKIIETEKARILVIGGLPKDAYDFKMFNDKDRPYLSYRLVYDAHRLYVQEGVLGVIGWLSKVTEEQCLPIAQPYSVGGFLLAGYTNHLDARNMSWFNTAKESLQSLIEANINLENEFENPFLLVEYKK